MTYWSWLSHLLLRLGIITLALCAVTIAAAIIITVASVFRLGGHAHRRPTESLSEFSKRISSPNHK